MNSAFRFRQMTHKSPSFQGDGREESEWKPWEGARHHTLVRCGDQVSLASGFLPHLGQVMDTPCELCAEGSSQSVLPEPHVAANMINFFFNILLLGKHFPRTAPGNLKVRAPNHNCQETDHEWGNQHKHSKASLWGQNGGCHRPSEIKHPVSVQTWSGLCSEVENLVPEASAMVHNQEYYRWSWIPTELGG